MQFGEMQYGSCHTNNPQGEQQHNYHINYQQPNINQNNLFSPFGWKNMTMMQSLWQVLNKMPIKVDWNKTHQSTP